MGRALPRAYLQADLDIVTLPGSTPTETLLADAEVIRTVSEVSGFHLFQLAQNCRARLENLPNIPCAFDNKMREARRDPMRIRLSAQVMDALPEWSGELEVRLGHRSLLDASLTHAHVPKVSRCCHLQTAAPPTIIAPVSNRPNMRITQQPAMLVDTRGSPTCEHSEDLEAREGP